MTDLFPTRDQARALVISLAIFWAGWGVAVLGLSIDIPVLGAPAAVLAIIFGFRFYIILYRVWEPETGESPWRMMFVPIFSRSRLRGTLHMFDLFRPRWVRRTLRETGWNARFVGLGLLGLLTLDLILFLGVLPRIA